MNKAVLMVSGTCFLICIGMMVYLLTQVTLKDWGLLEYMAGTIATGFILGMASQLHNKDGRGN